MYSVHVQCNCNSGEALQKIKINITECPMTNTVNIELEFSNNHFDEFFKHVVFGGLGNRNELHAKKFQVQVKPYFTVLLPQL